MTADTEKLKALALAATEGPWTFEVEDYAPNHVRAKGVMIAQVIGDSAECDATAAYIAAANPATVLELCNENAELRAEVERLRARFEYIEDRATTIGGGNGFKVTFFVPVDHEDIGCGIDVAIEKEKA